MKCPGYISVETKTGRQHVPCGKCAICLVNKQQEWAFRLHEEHKDSNSAHFLTMTYDEECLPWGETMPTLDKRDTQLFIKKLRKANDSAFKIMLKRKEKGFLKHFSELELKSIRYYLVGEYGPETERPHYHAIIFNVLPRVIDKINEIWNLGHIKIGEVNATTINYVTKYCISTKTGNQDRFNGKNKEFATMSRKPGLGHNYITNTEQYHRDLKNDTVKKPNGSFASMPGYYKQKIFTSRGRRDLQSRKIILSTKRNREEYERLEALGNDPHQIQFEATKNKIQKIEKNSKNNKL